MPRYRNKGRKKNEYKAAPRPRNGPSALQEIRGLDKAIRRVSAGGSAGTEEGAALRPRGMRAREAFPGGCVSINTVLSDTFFSQIPLWGTSPHTQRTRREHACVTENNPHSLLLERGQARRCPAGANVRTRTQHMGLSLFKLLRVHPQKRSGHGAANELAV